MALSRGPASEMTAVDTVRCVLAGTMGRTAVIDNDVSGIEFLDKMPGPCLRDMATQVDMVVIANFGKSQDAGMRFGAMVTERAGVACPVVQIECSGPFFVEWVKGCCPGVIHVFEEMGIPRKEPIKLEPSVWETEGRTYRRMTSTVPGDFILVDGTMVGRATGNEVVLVSENGHIVEIQGADVKEHGIEKLDRFGGVNLRAVKLASTRTIRRMDHSPRIQKTHGRGVAFVDHAGMYVYDLVRDVEGVVTVGDDTTAVVADILYRYQIPVIGIVDGDADVILQKVHFKPGSLKLTVPHDDVFGIKVRDSVLDGKQEIDISFAEMRDRILELVGEDLVARQDF